MRQPTAGKGPHVLALSPEKERGTGGQGAVAARGAAGRPGLRGADVSEVEAPKATSPATG